LADLPQTVKVALDELRMQMLGAQVLFGFQLQSSFQNGFDDISRRAKAVDAAALSLIVITFAILIAAPSQHRLVEQGNATPRILAVATRFANRALLPFALAIGCDIFVVFERYLGAGLAAWIAAGSSVAALYLLYGLGETVRALIPMHERTLSMTQSPQATLHQKIEQLLVESRVILPGAQALFGFQLVVTMTKAFERMSDFDRHIHFGALLAIALAMMLLVTPAALHRIAFGGQDSERFHRLGSLIVTLALIPLGVGIVLDFYIAAGRMLDNEWLAGAGAAAAGALLLFLWLALPLSLRTARH